MAGGGPLIAGISPATPAAPALPAAEDARRPAGDARPDAQQGTGDGGGGLGKGTPRAPLCPFTPPPTPVDRSLEVAGSGEASARSRCLTFIAYKILKIPLVTCAALPNSAQSIPRSRHDPPGLVAWGVVRDCCKSSSHKSLLPILGDESSINVTPNHPRAQ